MTILPLSSLAPYLFPFAPDLIPIFPLSHSTPRRKTMPRSSALLTCAPSAADLLTCAASPQPSVPLTCAPKMSPWAADMLTYAAESPPGPVAPLTCAENPPPLCAADLLTCASESPPSAADLLTCAASPAAVSVDPLTYAVSPPPSAVDPLTCAGGGDAGGKLNNLTMTTGGGGGGGDECGKMIDEFDKLPDPIVLLILNLVGDVKSLGRCSVVSLRFNSLVPLVDSVVVRIDCVISDDASTPSTPADKPRAVLSHITRMLLRPIHALTHILSRRVASPPSPEISHHSPTQVLKSFRELRQLRIELPAGELGVDDGVLLKWKANFGSSLDSCVILGASEHSSPVEDTISEAFYTNGSLKLRVVWTISSLIAASARHYLLQPIIADHETLQSLDLTDADGQGVLTMDRGQVEEMRVKPASASGSSSQRTLVPALSMRLWYAPQLELPGGKVLKGATLVAIRPSEEKVRDVVAEACWIAEAFEEPYRTAAVMLLKRRNYCLEMNSF